MKMTIALVALGSALGGVMRYLVTLALAGAKGFPWATLSVNVVGSFLIGLFSGLIAKQWGGTTTGEMIRCFAVIGICGGFTTFSTFSNETFRLLQANAWLSATLYVTASIFAGLLAVFLGYLISK